MRFSANTIQQFRELLPLLWTRLPGQLILQYSDACNANCPQCELRTSSKFKRSKIAVDDMKRAIDAAAENGVRALSFTGGEPFLYTKELLELIGHAGRAGIKYTRTGTNGFMFMHSHRPDWKSRIERFAQSLAETDLYTFWISIDSADPAVHDEMRGLPGVMRGIEKAVPILHKHGIYPSANLGINRNVGGEWIPALSDRPSKEDLQDLHETFRASFTQFYQFVCDLGFTITNACYPMSIQSEVNTSLSAVYGATSANEIVRFSRTEKSILFRALLETIPAFCGRLRIFTPLSSVYSLARYYAEGDEGYPCLGGIHYFFVDAQNANTYPCGFRSGENLGKYWDLDLRKIDRQAFCRQCDWECYRDPSELLGPLQEFRQDPISLLNRFRSDPARCRLWWRDLRYYMACSMFSGRRTPDIRKMTAFANVGTEVLLRRSSEESGRHLESGQKEATYSKRVA